MLGTATDSRVCDQQTWSLSLMIFLNVHLCISVFLLVGSDWTNKHGKMLVGWSGDAYE